ncbi:hypothetical protein [Novispirillum itersonii]|uniref:hypothetical protein n=1 Tax=Novispirillum itersonii TaxID=189 RepID=UPI000382BBDB|nr:hypothetical protein [Novispirillum itersonii]
MSCSVKDAKESIQQSLAALEAAFNAADSADEKARVHRCIHRLNQELIRIESQEIGGKYTPSVDVQSIIDDLETVKRNVERLCNVINGASKIIGAITKVVSIII